MNQLLFCFLFLVPLIQSVTTCQRQDNKAGKSEGANLPRAGRFTTSFDLYTREGNLYRIQKTNDVRSIERAGYDERKPVTFIVHGFQSSGDKEWITDMANKILQVTNNRMNVIIVDWTKGADENCVHYNRAVANTQKVGQDVYTFYDFLHRQLSLDYGKIHIIGHSLGAHVAGYAARANQNRKIGRISGLDPAGPWYGPKNPENIPLRMSDATFVDVIHTDVTKLGYGKRSPMGHADFYPNGGKQQPGCKKIKGCSCSHARARKYYAESILNNTKCYFMARQCRSFEDYQQNRCNENRANTMGYYAKKINANNQMFYLKTNEKAPFCADPIDPYKLHHTCEMYRLEELDATCMKN